MVCAHGGDAAQAPPNTMRAFRAAIDGGHRCIEVFLRAMLILRSGLLDGPVTCYIWPCQGNEVGMYHLFEVSNRRVTKP